MSNHRKNDDIACFICDYWGAILAVFLIACVLLVYKVWCPRLIGQNSETQAIPSPVAIASMESKGTPDPVIPPVITDQTGTPEMIDTPVSEEEIGDWLTFTDTRLGYSITYPSPWFATPQDLKTAEMQDSVLFSDVPGSTNPQARSSGENARVWIASYYSDGVEQTQWIIQHFNWISGELTSTTVGGQSAQAVTFMQADQPSWINQMTWIDRGGTTLLVWAQYQKDSPEVEAFIQYMLVSLNFASQ